MVQEGTANANSTGHLQMPQQQATQYGAYDYFGERNLLKTERNDMNVVAHTDCVIVTLHRHSVKRLLGPLGEILKRN